MSAAVTGYERAVQTAGSEKFVMEMQDIVELQKY
jgi:hypothetical protein